MLQVLLSVTPVFNDKITDPWASSSGPRNPGEEERQYMSVSCKQFGAGGGEFNFVFSTALSSILSGEKVVHVIHPSVFWEGD